MVSESFSQPPPAFTPGDYNANILHDEANLPNYSASTEPDIWERFFKVTAASLQMADAKRRLFALEHSLEKQSKELKKHRENTTELFRDLHRRSALETIQLPLNVLKRIPSGRSQIDEKKHKQREDFEASHRLESRLQQDVHILEEQRRELQSKIDMNASLASEMDQVFELVAGQAAATLSNDSQEVRSAEEDLAMQIDSYNKAEEAANSFRRACVTIQHAHHYYNEALQRLDSVRSGAGRIVFAGVSEISKNKEYQAATVVAGKAQVCLNETIRVMEPYTTRMPNDILSHFEQLKTLGLLQATKIYDLMYGWKRKTGEISGSMKLMLQKQDTAFACLTWFAVWVQDRVPVIESEVQSSQLMKIAAQKRLVDLWKEQCSNLVS